MITDLWQHHQHRGWWGTQGGSWPPGLARAAAPPSQLAWGTESPARRLPCWSYRLGLGKATPQARSGQAARASVPHARPCHCCPAASPQGAVRPSSRDQPVGHSTGTRRRAFVCSPEPQWERHTEGSSSSASAQPRHTWSRPHKRAQPHPEGWGGRGQVASTRHQNGYRRRHQALS